MSEWGKRKEINCKVCGKKMILCLARISKFCSAECYHKSREGKKPGNYGMHYFFVKRIEKVCSQCNKKFGVIPSDKNKKYCSPKCFQDSRLTKEEIIKRKILADSKHNKTDVHKQACMEWSKRHPERIKIASQTARAYKTGKIKIQPCEVCESKDNLQKHHPDYTKPLDIKWLCRKCHTELHKQIKRNILTNLKKVLK